MAGKQDISAFIRATFRSVWSLELLCLLRKDPTRIWTRAELVAALRASDLIVAQGVESLTAAGLVIVDTGDIVGYRPATVALDELAAAAEQLYARSPNRVRRLITSPVDGGVSAFAEAFRLWKD